MTDGPSGRTFPLSVGGETHGPYAESDLRAWLASGQVSPDALVWDGGAWRPVGDVLGAPVGAAADEAQRRAIGIAMAHGAGATLGTETKRMKYRYGLIAAGLALLAVGGNFVFGLFQSAATDSRSQS